MTFGMTGGDGGFDPLVLLLMALFVEAYVGEAQLLFKAVPHPVRMIGGMVGLFDHKLNLENRSEADRALRGALVVVVLVALGHHLFSEDAWWRESLLVPHFAMLEDWTRRLAGDLIAYLMNVSGS